MDIYLKQVAKKIKSLKTLPNWLKQFLAPEEQIKIIRNTLGMTQSQLARKLGLSSNVPVAKLENKENKNPTVETLKRYAEALECKLLIRFVPKKELSVLLNELAEKKAQEIVHISSGNSAMELQKPDKETIEYEISRIKKELLDKKRGALWE